MARELITKSEIINKNWMYTVIANADGRVSCSSAAYLPFAPIGGCVYKKLLDLFFPFANISLECNFNAVEKRSFLLQ
jgi:hypothetical protein